MCNKMKSQKKNLLHSKNPISPRNENSDFGPNKFLKINFFIFLKKNWKIYWSEQSFTDLGRRTGGHREDCQIEKS